MEEKKFSIKESLIFGRDSFADNAWFMVVMLFLISGIAGLPGFIKIFDEGILYYFTYIAAQIISILFSVALVKASIEMYHGNKPKVADIGKLMTVTPKFFFKYLGLSLTIVFIVVIGLFLFVVPGIIWSIKYMLAPYFMIEYDLSIKESMNRSAKATNGFKMDLFLFLLAGVGIIYASMIPAGIVIGLAFLLPQLAAIVLVIVIIIAIVIFIFFFSGILEIAQLYIYKKLSTDGKNELDEGPNKEEDKKIDEDSITEDLLSE